MNNLSIYDELDQAIEAMVSQPESPSTEANPAIAELLSVASELRQLPRPDFRLRLKTELDWVASGRPTCGHDRMAAKNPAPAAEKQMLASLFGTSYGAYPVRHVNFVASVALHAVAMVLMIGSAFWFAHHVGPHVEAQVSHVIVLPEDILNTPSHSQAHGGGGAGTADLLPASKGALPPSANIQKTPPLVVLRNDHPRLTAQPTIIGPDLRVPQNDPVGDPLSALATPSNGPGVRSGIGPGTGTGVGPGNGTGHGPGSDGGSGGGVHGFGAGSRLIAPTVIYDPDPEYSPEARAAKYQGSVLLWAVIGPDGVPRELRVARALGMGLDEKALEAVRTWRFQPATQDGHPVSVMIEVEVSFHLY